MVICFCLLLASICVSTVAETVNLRGDLNGDSRFNSIDMVVMRRYMMNKYSLNNIAYSADLNIDNIVDIRDLVSMKKYLVGTIIHRNRTEEGLVWYFLKDNNGDFPLVGGVGFRFITSCYVETACLPGRYTSEIFTYIQTTKNPNPEIKLPKLGVGITTIDDKNLTFESNKNVIAAPDTIWCSEISKDSLNVSERSSFSCLFTIMLDDTTFPYREIKNIFKF